ncbi:MAG: DivIVA domain-containing protein [Acidimicrobiales bacterium]
MDATPHLLTDVRFSERRKGYDPEEVDNFLAQVSEKVAQLQEMVREATARADGAERARSLAEAEIDKLKADLARHEAAPARVLDEQAEAERASRILLMAQKTADATIEDANRAAQRAIADARQQAAALLAEAQAEAEKLRVEAKRQVDELVAQRRGQILSEVGELEKVRDQLAADVEALREHLEAERAKLLRTLDAIKQAVEEPEALRVTAPPALRAPSVPREAPVAEATTPEGAAGEGSTPAGPAGQTAVSETPAGQAPAGEASEPAPVAAGTSGGGEPSSEGSAAAPAAVEAEAGAGLDTPASGQAEESPGGAADAGDPAVSGAEGKAPGDETDRNGSGDQRPDAEGPGAESAERVDLTTEKLFDNVDAGEAPLDTGPPTELFTPFAGEGEADDPLGAPDAEADAAMRAFFEADFDEEPEPKRSRWRR